MDVAVTTVASDDEARAAVLDGDADVAVAADGARIFTEDELDLTSGSSRATLVSVLRAELALENGLRAAGLSPDEAAEVRAAPPPDVEALAAEPDDEVDSERVGTAMVTNILLFLMLQTYGGWVLTAVTREKASRVVEVLLAVITPRQLLIGKVVGIGIVALIHAAVLIATALVATRVMGVDLSIGASPGDLAIALVWFVLGYALYCGAFAAAGSLVSRTEDAQGAAFPIMLPLLFAYIVSFSAADGANTLHVGAGVHPVHRGGGHADAVRAGRGAAVGGRREHAAHRGGRRRRDHAGRQDLRALGPAQPQALLARRLPPARRDRHRHRARPAPASAHLH